MNPPTPPVAVPPGDERPVTPQQLRRAYEAGEKVSDLVTRSGLSYGTVINRLHAAGTPMRTGWQTRQQTVDVAARRRLAAGLRTLYDQHGATLAELAEAGAGNVRAARRLLIEAGGKPRTSQQTLRLRKAGRLPQRRKLARALRAEYLAGASVAELAEEHPLSVATIYRLLHLAKTPMRPRYHRSHRPKSAVEKRS